MLSFIGLYSVISLDNRFLGSSDTGVKPSTLGAFDDYSKKLRSTLPVGEDLRDSYFLILNCSLRDCRSCKI